MNKILYFAYGSNILRERIERRVGTVELVENYRLYDYELVFNAGLSSNLSFANIRKEKQSFVDGVLYELTDRQICLLDNFEGYPYSYQKFYKIETFKIYESRIIFGYYVKNPVYPDSRPPDVNYLDLIIKGAIENDLTELSSKLIIYKSNNYEKKRKRRIKIKI